MIEEIKKIAKEFNLLAKQAIPIYSKQVDSIISSESTDQNHIEHTLDWMLDFCFDADMLILYKKLCRYYYYINPQATVDYVNIYREMWDSESEE